ncbi:CDP-glycerol glycerophosphotransferase family protein [Salegentibacter salegens]|uniref:CDP-Glycerol:Poly(Glycerophosphate) glycerophosphotransferase n=1 Tax=Salegentibacter salegens TaxID=143223 RepID=A0A1M7NVY2_9FLAO|nr:CDP-glycerol glycerophosphotransferase family protein [Salegentibacter salegens]PRX45748.1 CDP-glycerol:poly(glycerophosphate) glycerophosphotransferase [Salegentibacter salegens]SHN08362.1 CDP-Glycerol:Poly(glycerophosphate) glycerophosphotransferase [Salegentibacter salegens]
MKYRFLIYISYPYALPIGAPLQEEIMKRGYEVKWFCDVKETKEYFPKNGELLPEVNDAVLYNPDVVLTITDSVADFIPGIKVQVFHGFPANKRKGTDQFKIRGFFDLYCTQGPSSTIPFQEKQRKHKNFEVIETGWSKLDPLFPLEPTTNEKPVVLIASTFTKQYSLALNEAVVAEIERLSKTNRWKFMAVLHPKLSKEVYRKFKALENENFRFYDTTNLVPLFKKADVMFADTTSALIEFLIQEKPVITFKNNMPGPYLIDISKVSEIEPALKKAVSKPAYLMEEIKTFADYSHPYRDGNSSERVLDSCIEFLHKDRSHLKKKPLNLIRKYKMRKKLGYFKF